MPRQAKAHQDKAQQDTVRRVMHEFKHGQLETAQGGKVRNPRQAIAIALREAGGSDQQTPAQQKAALRHTKARQGTATRAELYAEAQQRGIAGRSRMTKDELQKALRRS